MCVGAIKKWEKNLQGLKSMPNFAVLLEKSIAWRFSVEA